VADNVAYQSATPATPPAATNIATDQLGTGEHVQYVKIMDGTLDGTAKAAVGATGLRVADAKDTARVNLMWTAEFSPASVTEDLLTVTQSADGAATTTFSSRLVTSGKRLRISTIGLGLENTLGTAVQRAQLRMRFNTAGAVTASSPQQHVLTASVSGTLKSVTSTVQNFPDGIEFAGDGTKQIGFTLQTPDWVILVATVKVYVSVFGFEY
jgi:hypothetical protein